MGCYERKDMLNGVKLKTKQSNVLRIKFWQKNRNVKIAIITRYGNEVK